MKASLASLTVDYHNTQPYITNWQTLAWITIHAPTSGATTRTETITGHTDHNTRSYTRSDSENRLKLLNRPITIHAPT